MYIGSSFAKDYMPVYLSVRISRLKVEALYSAHKLDGANTRC